MSPHWQRGMDSPSASAQQKTKTQTHACAILGRPSLWVLSLGRSRESTSPVRARPDLKSQHRDSDNIQGRTNVM